MFSPHWTLLVEKHNTLSLCSQLLTSTARGSMRKCCHQVQRLGLWSRAHRRDGVAARLGTTSASCTSELSRLRQSPSILYVHLLSNAPPPQRLYSVSPPSYAIFPVAAGAQRHVTGPDHAPQGPIQWPNRHSPERLFVGFWVTTASHAPHRVCSHLENKVELSKDKVDMKKTKFQE